MRNTTDKSVRRLLRPLSDCALLITAVVWIFQWSKDNEFEKVIKDPVAQEFWLETRVYYNFVAWISIISFIVLRLSYWIIEFLYDRRSVSRRKAAESQTLP